MPTEEKIVKIVDTTVHTRGASVEQVGTKGALVVASATVTPTDSLSGNSSYALSNVNDVAASTVYVTKTMDAVQYRRTLTYNSDGNLIGVSSWEEI